jgi:predicted esterase
MQRRSRVASLSSFCLSLAVLAGLAGPAPLSAQTASDDRPDFNTIDKASRAARIARIGTLGFPPLPDVTAETPDDTIFYADRMPFGAKPPAGGTIAAVAMVDHAVDASITGTGFDELIQYQLPEFYDDQGPGHPLVVAYHGFGGSAGSVALLSTIDEECNSHNWVYLSVTGLDDQLFGSPISQQNTEAGIQYILDNFNIDEDRIYMVGFSVGGGIVANFAARHRDPEGLMIAALGVVSGTQDWALEYNIGVAELKLWLILPENFGGPPSTELFAYQQVGGLYCDPASYPPASSATTLSVHSMATNLAKVPTYITYDTDDPILHVPHMCDELETLLLSLGGTVTKTVTTDTSVPGPPSIPAPHSWAVLDEVGLFNFLDGKSVNRYPGDFQAQQDLGGPVSWLETTRHRTDAFVYIDGDVDFGTQHVSVSTVSNASALDVDFGTTGIASALPVRFSLTNDDSSKDLPVTLTGFSQAPHRLHDHTTGSLITLVDSDPASGSLTVHVPAGTSLDVDVVHDPLWTSVLTTTPNPVPIGNLTTLAADGPATSTVGLLVFAVQEQLLNVGGGVILTAWPLAPALRLFVPLDINGDFSIPTVIPNDPGLIGLRIPTQLVTLDAGTIQSVSNLWGMSFE